ncbi:hypothetical protein IRJ41_020624, partial [Triplophysa rosa]
MCSVSATPTTHTHPLRLKEGPSVGGIVPKKGSQRSCSPIASLRAGAGWAERQFPADDPCSQSLRPGSPSIQGGASRGGVACGRGAVIEPPVCAIYHRLRWASEEQACYSLTAAPCLWDGWKYISLTCHQFAEG